MQRLLRPSLVLVLAAGLACRAPAPSNAEPTSPPTSTSPGAQLLTFSGSFLDRAEYDGAKRSLKVFFDDKSVYEYADVPPEVFAGLRKADGDKDAANYFNDSVRSKFAFKRLTPATTMRSPTPPKPARTPVTCPNPTTMAKRAVTSVVLDAVSYDAQSRCMVLYFDSKHVYKYGPVPSAVYQTLIAPGADPSSYFNKEVRNRFGSQRVR